jgi:P27 family predicted phage terminase small subunit
VWLSEDAKHVFDETAERLQAAGILTAVDAFALARYADLCVEYRRCAEFVAKHGTVYVVRGRPGINGEEGRPIGFKTYPQAKLQLAYSAALLQLERDFGMTPASRTGLTVEEPHIDEHGLEDYYFGTSPLRR